MRGWTGDGEEVACEEECECAKHNGWSASAQGGGEGVEEAQVLGMRGGREREREEALRRRPFGCVLWCPGVELWARREQAVKRTLVGISSERAALDS